jgi:hypothetical protein
MEESMIEWKRAEKERKEARIRAFLFVGGMTMLGAIASGSLISENRRGIMKALANYAGTESTAEDFISYVMSEDSKKIYQSSSEKAPISESGFYRKTGTQQGYAVFGMSLSGSGWASTGSTRYFSIDGTKVAGLSTSYYQYSSSGDGLSYAALDLFKYVADWGTPQSGTSFVPAAYTSDDRGDWYYASDSAGTESRFRYFRTPDAEYGEYSEQRMSISETDTGNRRWASSKPSDSKDLYYEATGSTRDIYLMQRYQSVLVDVDGSNQAMADAKASYSDGTYAYIYDEETGKFRKYTIDAAIKYLSQGTSQIDGKAVESLSSAKNSDRDVWLSISASEARDINWWDESVSSGNFSYAQLSQELSSAADRGESFWSSDGSVMYSLDGLKKHYIIYSNDSSFIFYRNRYVLSSLAKAIEDSSVTYTSAKGDGSIFWDSESGKALQLNGLEDTGYTESANTVSYSYRYAPVKTGTQNVPLSGLGPTQSNKAEYGAKGASCQTAAATDVIAYLHSRTQYGTLEDRISADGSFKDSGTASFVTATGKLETSTSYTYTAESADRYVKDSSSASYAADGGFYAGASERYRNRTTSVRYSLTDRGSSVSVTDSSGRSLDSVFPTGTTNQAGNQGSGFFTSSSGYASQLSRTEDPLCSFWSKKGYSQVKITIQYAVYGIPYPSPENGYSAQPPRTAQAAVSYAWVKDSDLSKCVNISTNAKSTTTLEGLFGVEFYCQPWNWSGSNSSWAPADGTKDADPEDPAFWHGPYVNVYQPSSTSWSNTISSTYQDRSIDTNNGQLDYCACSSLNPYSIGPWSHAYMVKVETTGITCQTAETQVNASGTEDWDEDGAYFHIPTGQSIYTLSSSTSKIYHVDSSSESTSTSDYSSSAAAYGSGLSQTLEVTPAGYSGEGSFRLYHGELSSFVTSFGAGYDSYMHYSKFYSSTPASSKVSVETAYGGRYYLGDLSSTESAIGSGSASRLIGTDDRYPLDASEAASLGASGAPITLGSFRTEDRTLYIRKPWDYTAVHAYDSFCSTDGAQASDAGKGIVDSVTPAAGLKGATAVSGMAYMPYTDASGRVMRYDVFAYTSVVRLASAPVSTRLRDVWYADSASERPDASARYASADSLSASAAEGTVADDTVSSWTYYTYSLNGSKRYHYREFERKESGTYYGDEYGTNGAAGYMNGTSARDAAVGGFGTVASSSDIPASDIGGIMVYAGSEATGSRGSSEGVGEWLTDEALAAQHPTATMSDVPLASGTEMKAGETICYWDGQQRWDYYAFSAAADEGRVTVRHAAYGTYAGDGTASGQKAGGPSSCDGRNLLDWKAYTAWLWSMKNKGGAEASYDSAAHTYSYAANSTPEYTLSGLKAGKAYTVTVGTAQSGTTLEAGGTASSSLENGRISATFTAYGPTAKLRIRASSAEGSVSFSWMQLEEGGTFTAYMPYGSSEALTYSKDAQVKERQLGYRLSTVWYEMTDQPSAYAENGTYGNAIGTDALVLGTALGVSGERTAAYGAASDADRTDVHQAGSYGAGASSRGADGTLTVSGIYSYRKLICESEYAETEPKIVLSDDPSAVTLYCDVADASLTEDFTSLGDGYKAMTYNGFEYDADPTKAANWKDGAYFAKDGKVYRLARRGLSRYTLQEDLNYGALMSSTLLQSLGTLRGLGGRQAFVRLTASADEALLEKAYANWGASSSSAVLKQLGDSGIWYFEGTGRTGSASMFMPVSPYTDEVGGKGAWFAFGDGTARTVIAAGMADDMGNGAPQTVSGLYYGYDIQERSGKWEKESAPYGSANATFSDAFGLSDSFQSKGLSAPNGLLVLSQDSFGLLYRDSDSSWSLGGGKIYKAVWSKRPATLAKGEHFVSYGELASVISSMTEKDSEGRPTGIASGNGLISWNGSLFDPTPIDCWGGQTIILPTQTPDSWDEYSLFDKETDTKLNGLLDNANVSQYETMDFSGNSVSGFFTEYFSDGNKQVKAMDGKPQTMQITFGTKTVSAVKEILIRNGTVDSTADFALGELGRATFASGSQAAEAVSYDDYVLIAWYDIALGEEGDYAGAYHSLKEAAISEIKSCMYEEELAFHIGDETYTESVRRKCQTTADRYSMLGIGFDGEDFTGIAPADGTFRISREIDDGQVVLAKEGGIYFVYGRAVSKTDAGASGDWTAEILSAGGETYTLTDVSMSESELERAVDAFYPSSALSISQKMDEYLAGAKVDERSFAFRREGGDLYALYSAEGAASLKSDGPRDVACGSVGVNWADYDSQGTSLNYWDGLDHVGETEEDSYIGVIGDLINHFKDLSSPWGGLISTCNITTDRINDSFTTDGGSTRIAVASESSIKVSYANKYWRWTGKKDFSKGSSSTERMAMNIPMDDVDGIFWMDLDGRLSKDIEGYSDMPPFVGIIKELTESGEYSIALAKFNDGDASNDWYLTEENVLLLGYSFDVARDNLDVRRYMAFEASGDSTGAAGIAGSPLADSGGWIIDSSAPADESLFTYSVDGNDCKGTGENDTAKSAFVDSAGEPIQVKAVPEEISFSKEAGGKSVGELIKSINIAAAESIRSEKPELMTDFEEARRFSKSVSFRLRHASYFMREGSICESVPSSATAYQYSEVEEYLLVRYDSQYTFLMKGGDSRMYYDTGLRLPHGQYSGLSKEYDQLQGTSGILKSFNTFDSSKPFGSGAFQTVSTTLSAVAGSGLSLKNAAWSNASIMSKAYPRAYINVSYDLGYQPRIDDTTGYMIEAYPKNMYSSAFVTDDAARSDVKSLSDFEAIAETIPSAPESPYATVKAESVSTDSDSLLNSAKYSIKLALSVCTKDAAGKEETTDRSKTGSLIDHYEYRILKGGVVLSPGSITHVLGGEKSAGWKTSDKLFVYLDISGTNISGRDFTVEAMAVFADGTMTDVARTTLRTSDDLVGNPWGSSLLGKADVSIAYQKPIITAAEMANFKNTSTDADAVPGLPYRYRLHDKTDGAVPLVAEMRLTDGINRWYSGFRFAFVAAEDYKNTQSWSQRLISQWSGDGVSLSSIVSSSGVRFSDSLASAIAVAGTAGEGASLKMYDGTEASLPQRGTVDYVGDSDAVDPLTKEVTLERKDGLQLFDLTDYSIMLHTDDANQIKVSNGIMQIGSASLSSLAGKPLKLEYRFQYRISAETLYFDFDGSGSPTPYASEGFFIDGRPAASEVASFTAAKANAETGDWIRSANDRIILGKAINGSQVWYLGVPVPTKGVIAG